MMPHWYEKEPGGMERAYDIPSRLLKDRIILLNGAFDEQMSRAIVSQLLLLDSQDQESEIQLYINSPGGVITDGLAILDTMMMIKSPVHTIVNGLAASMGAFIATLGDRRSAMPNAEIMIHQPLGGAQGQATEIEIAAKRILGLKEKLAKYMAHKCNKPVEVLLEDMERDNWFDAKRAKEYGLIDEVIPYSKDLPIF